MKVNFFDMVHFWVILIASLIFKDIEVKRYPNRSFLQKKEQVFGSASFIQEGEVSQSQKPLLHINETEECLHEENRRFPVDEAALIWGKNFLQVIVIPYMEKLKEERATTEPGF